MRIQCILVFCCICINGAGLAGCIAEPERRHIDSIDGGGGLDGDTRLDDAGPEVEPLEDADVVGDFDALSEEDGDVIPAEDAEPEVDGDEPGDADLEMVDPPAEPRLGSSVRPIPVASLPFHDVRDTADAPEASIDFYGCAPDVPERGPEVHYLVTVDHGAELHATVEERGVDVDLHLLETDDPEDCLARDDRHVTVAVAPGSYRLVVDTYGDGSATPGTYRIDLWLEELDPVRSGDLEVEYYYLVEESEHEGARTTPLYDTTCTLIDSVRPSFHAALCIEGSGVLEDGTVVNYGGRCGESCPEAPVCGSGSRRVCFTALDPSDYPWGMGASGVALVPDVSATVHPDVAMVGEVLYIEELDGIVPPPDALDPHDGCVRVDDSGAIDEDRIRVFAGTRSRWRAWEGIFRTGTGFTVWRDHPRCFGL